jgi:site-specific DNA-cytosine methylase
MMSHSELAAMNRRLVAADKRWVLIDAYSGGCGATVSAIQAGVFVKAAFEAAEPEIITFEELTGQINLGSIDQHNFKRGRIPRSHLWWTSSSCKDFSPLGSRKGEGGRKGGDHFEHQSKYARAAGVLAIMFENVNGVATLKGRCHSTLTLHIPPSEIQDTILKWIGMVEGDTRY